MMRRSTGAFSTTIFSTLLLIALAHPAFASPDDRTVVSILTSPCNSFDNRIPGDSVGIRLDVSGAAPAYQNPDNQGGSRMEIYNASGSLVRRLASQEVNTDPTQIIYWNGQGDSNVSDTLAYGAYTLRTYLSMRDPAVTASVKGTGITMSRPGDLHVTSGGVLTWTNTGTSLSFCQVSLGDSTEAPTFLRLVEFPAGMGAVNADQAYGIVMNSANEIFVTDNNGGAAIAKYSTATEAWISMTWATNATTSLADDEWYGLGIDSRDSVYLAAATAIAGGGSGGTIEFVVRFKDNGTTATQDAITASQTEDYYDVAPLAAGDSVVYATDMANDQIDRYLTTLAASADPLVDLGALTTLRSIAATPDGKGIYVARGSSFLKMNATGGVVYTVTENILGGASGIALWQKTATNETFVIVCSQTNNQIHIYKENTPADTAVFVRSIQDDVYNLATPQGISMATDSAVFVVNSGSRSVKKFSQDGVFQNLPAATNGQFIQGIDGTADLSDSNAFGDPRAIAVDTDANIYVFDHNAAVTQIALKKFTVGGAPLGVIMDLDATWAAGVFNSRVTEALYASGAIYAATLENGGRVLRISETGALLGHLGNASTAGGDPAEGNTAADVIGLQVAPFFDRAANAFYPAAVYLYLTTEVVEIWRTDFSGGRITTLTPTKTTNTTPTTNPQAFLVDNAGEIYLMDDGTSGGNYLFRKWNSATPDTTLGLNEMLAAPFAQGSGATQFNAPRQAVWTDNVAVFAFNASSGRYERKIWVNDSANNRLQQVLLSWNDVVETPVTVILGQDTPTVSAASITGNTVVVIGGTTYVGLDTITVQINFGLNGCGVGMDPAALPAITVEIQPSGGSFTPVNQVSYSGAVWSGTVPITAGMNNGEAIIKVENAYDNAGVARLISPHPGRTDSFDTDDFKPFVIDQTPPSGSVSTPPAGNDTVSQATYNVAGSITEDLPSPPNFKDATIVMTTYTTLGGATQIDSATVTASAVDGSFSANLDLGGIPSDNWLDVVAIDKVGNRASLFTPRRNIRRETNVGSAFIEPTSSGVGQIRRYLITYTAAQTLTGDTLRFTIPSGWSAPQKTTPTTGGYVTVTATGSYSDSIVSGQFVTCTGVSLSIGGTLKVAYGDSVVDPNGRAGPDVNQPLDDPSNAFKAEIQFASGGGFATVSPPSGKTLTVSLTDSNASMAVYDTGPRAAADAQIAKGEETRVLVLRFYNTNQGNHSDKITQVQLSVESNTGGVVAWNQVASQVVAKNTDEGITFATIASMPASQSLTVSPTGFTIGQGSSRNMEFWVTISSNAAADTVRFFVAAPTSANAVDSASNKTLIMTSQETGVTGKKTGNYDIIGLLPADTCGIGFTDPLSGEVATGQVGVSAMRLVIDNRPPAPETPVNQIRIDQLVLQVRRADGTTALAGNAVMSSVRVIDETTGTQYGGVTPGASETLTMTLSGFVLASGEARSVRIEVDIAANTATTSQFRLRLSDTPLVTAKDKVTNQNADVWDMADLPGVLPYRIDTITIVPVGEASLVRIRLLNQDSSPINGAAGDQIVLGDAFYAAVQIRATASRSSVRVIPHDTDLVMRIAGVDRTSEFTITKPATKTVTAGATDTFIYGIVQNAGISTGTLSVDNDTTSADTRPRAYDAHDFVDPDRLRAIWNDTAAETVAIIASPILATASTLDTSYANAAETSVAILAFSIKNNRVTGRNLDSVVVEGISAGSPVTLVRLYHDDDNSLLSPALDTQVASGVLNASDTVLLTLSPQVSIGANGGSETFFITFDFASALTDNDTFDARLPALGVRVVGEGAVPTSSPLNSSGEGRVEIVASILEATPDTQILAVGASPTVTLRALDAYGNVDAVLNAEAPTQGNNIQINGVFRASDSFTDTTHRISGTSGLTNVVISQESTAVNAKLSLGQGSLTLTDTEAEYDTLTVTSSLPTETAQVQFTQSITASGVNLTGNDSAAADSRAYLVMKFRVTNASAGLDTVTRVGVRSLTTTDAEVSAVILFRDLNGNGAIDTGTDRVVATGVFASGFVEFANLSDTVAVGDSGLYMVGFNIQTSATDNNIVDVQVDTVEVQAAGSITDTVLQSTPNRRIDIRALRIAHTLKTGSTATGTNFTETATAVDTFGNRDVGYTGDIGAGQKITWTLSGSAAWQSSTLSNEVIAPSNTIKGNFVQGRASLTFTDATAETTTLTVTSAPGLGGPHDTGAYVFEQGFTATAIALSGATSSAGDTDRVILSFRVSATGTSDSVTKVLVTWVGSDTDDVTNARLYKDMDGNELFSASLDALYGSVASFSDETVTFTGETLYVANGTSRAFFLVVDVANTSVIGDTLDAQLLASSITTQGMLANVPTGTRNSAGHETLVVGLAADSIAVSSLDVPPGTQNVIVGRFRIQNGKANPVSLSQVTVRNWGSHPDTGILNVECWVDTEPNGTVDDAFGTAGAFSNGSRTFAGNVTIVSGDTIDLFVRFDVSDTLAVDTKSLDAAILAGGIVFTNGDTLSKTLALNSVGIVRVAVGVTATLDSVSIAGGDGVADNVDTVTAVVTVTDTKGSPAIGRSVDLAGQIGPLTFVTPNPTTTDTHGQARFVVRTGTPGTYEISAVVSGSALNDSTFLSFIAANGASGENLGGNPTTNVSGQTGGGWIGNPSFGRVAGDANDYAYYRSTGAGNWQLVLNTVGGGVTTLLSTGEVVGSPNYLGSVRFRNIYAAGGDSVIYAEIDDIGNFRSEIIARSQTGSSDTVRISPNDPRDTAGDPNAHFIDASWKSFDFSPNGDSFVAEFTGNLVIVGRTGSTWDPAKDSANIKILTSWTRVVYVGGSPVANNRLLAADPVWSPDGNRIAFTLYHVSDNFPFGANPVDQADVWVIKGLSTVAMGTFPGTFSDVTETDNTHLVRISDTSQKFSWRPQWNRDGTVLMYSTYAGSGFDYENIASDYPYNTNPFSGTEFKTVMKYYNIAGETVPNAAIDVNSESGTDATNVAMSRTGTTRLVYVRQTSNTNYNVRTVDLASEATVTSAGGILFDSGLTVAVIPDGENLAAGTKIASQTPTSTPSGPDSSLVITGAAKSFYNPAAPDSPVLFSESVTVLLSYGASDIPSNQLAGFDSDSDGIPDRTEANLSVYWWNGTAWIPFETTRYPDQNRLEIRTTHFSVYAAGLYGAAAFGGSVQDAVVFPNPWRIDGIGTATSGLGAGNALYGVKIGNLPSAQVQIRIYTISGQKVLEGDIHTATGAGNTANGHLRALGDGRVSWDLRNQSGREVASGVYIIAISGPGGTATRKVAVIR